MKARQAAEEAAKQAERIKLAQAMAAGKGPKLPAVSNPRILLLMVWGNHHHKAPAMEWH